MPKDTLGVIKVWGGYRVAELVGQNGLYITWPELFETADGAYAHIREFKRRQNKMTEHRALEAIKAYRRDVKKALPLEVFYDFSGSKSWKVIYEDGEEQTFSEEAVKAFEEEYRTF